MKRIAFVFCAVAAWPCFSGVVNSPSESAIIASKASSADGWSYRTKTMAHLVNALRAMGKEKCLAELREYLRAADDHRAIGRVTLLCYCLFENPAGRWDKPALGSAVGYLNRNVEESIPTFPLYFYEDVPFLIITGYRSSGQIFGSAKKLLIQCESLELIDHDIPLTGHTETAKRLINSPTFSAFYSRQDDAEYMTKMILEQAEDAAVPKK